MSLQDPRPGASSQADDEVSRRRLALGQALESVLSIEELAQAVSLCDDEFPPTQPFSAPDFCQRLAEVIPGIELSQEVQLALLQSMWQPLDQVESDPPAVVDDELESGDLEALGMILVEDESELSVVEDVGEPGPEEVFEMGVPIDDVTEAETAEMFAIVVSDEMAMEEEAGLQTLNTVDGNGPDNRPSAADQVTYQNRTGQPYHEDQPSPELFRLRFANFGKAIIE